MREKKNQGFTLIELIVVIVILAILIGITISGLFSLINKARKNRDISVVNQINTATQGVVYSVDYDAMMKELQAHPTINSRLNQVYACTRFYINTPVMPSDGSMTWDEYFDAWKSSGCDYRTWYPVTVSCLSKVLPEGVPYMSKYNLQLYVGLAKDKQSVYIKAVICDFDTGKITLEGEILSDDDGQKYRDSILNCYYSWKYK